jgi:hypothetical protein
MKRWLTGVVLCAAFAAGIFATAVVNRTRSDEARYNVDTTIGAVVAAAGGKALPTGFTPPNMLQRLHKFEMAGCQLPYAVLPASMVQDPRGLMQRIHEVRDHSYSFRTIYLGEMNSDRQPLTWQLTKLQHMLMKPFGLSPFGPVSAVLYLAVPPGCQSHLPVDWLRVWTAPVKTSA